VAVDITGDDAGAARYLAEKGITFRSLHGDLATAARLYDVKGTPTSFVLDRDGRVLFRHFGFEGPDGVAQMRAEIEAILDRPATK
jgi:cytochrome c biogenesis protein CcmG/thiol:disulfide interchange protein DsbE